MQDKLEIILITYNRKEFLEKTFKQIFSQNSPVKNLHITILDNKSTDGTTEYITEFIKDFPNVTHIVHNRNIGANGNISRAMELATYPYLWILCDDDNYDWTHWKEIEDAINNDYDVIFTATDKFQHYKNDATIFREATFLPSTIYKTELITNDVMQNAMANIINLFPHLAIMSHAMNEKKRIFIPEFPVVIAGNRGNTVGETGFYSSAKVNTHPYVRDMFLIVGMINSVQMIKDKKQRNFILNHISAKKTGFFREISANFKRNRLYYNNSFKNVADVFCGINFPQKIQFLFSLIWLDCIYFIRKFILREKQYNLKNKN